MNGITKRSPMRIGYWLSEKKAKKLNFAGFADRMKQSTGVEVVSIDLTKPVDEQPLFDVIIHKLTDLMTAADRGDSDATKDVTSIESYIVRHPKVVVLDPLPNVRKLLDRSICYEEIKKIHFVVRDVTVCSPHFTTVRSSPSGPTLMNKTKLSFPVVCKHLVAHGSRVAHQMAIVFSDEGFKEVDFPFVAQQFICHSGQLYKIFVVGKRHFVVKRPSLKNLSLNRFDKSTIFFDSHDVSKADASSELNGTVDLEEDHRKLDDIVVAKIAETFREKLGLSLFGVDVVVEDHSNRHCIIDVNFFPGYEGFADFEGALEELLLNQTTSLPASGAKPANGLLSNGYQNGKILNGCRKLFAGFHSMNGASAAATAAADLDDSFTGQRAAAVTYI
ncbi:inositol-tetrakisphosphate 1-kinase-like isoform X2 [Oscarella lobularis]|uniref:inositol-tetrakisphosphate 1-kinase-like isoform X2 n=1 Tax=Oscarella lobularis TaxID=121494 RepID=UPI003313B141